MKKKFSLLFILILIVSGISTSIINNKKEDSNANNTQLNEIVNNILELNMDKYDYKKLEDIKIKVLDILENETRHTNILECNFILGNIYMQSNNNLEAISYFNKAIIYFDDKTNAEIKIY